jgi:hypothetical protein
MTLSVPVWLQNGTYSARLDRTFADVLFTEGIIDPGGGSLLVSERGIGPNNSTDVAVGIAVIEGDDETNQGKYVVRNDAVINLSFSPVPTVDPRIDLVVLEVNDATAGSLRTPADVADLRIIEGTPAVSPVVPAVPATAIALAEVLRTPGDSFIDNTMITDLRAAASQQQFTVNSRFEILTTAQRDALTPFVGQTIFNTDVDANQFWDGSQWVTFGATFFEAVTTAQRDALTPFVGQTIFNTDTDEIQFWDGSSWVVPSSLGNLSDVDLAGLADGDYLQYDSASGDWLPVQLPPPEDPIPLILALA